MDFLGVGPLEFIFLLIIILIVLGPRDMVKAGRTLGRWLRKLVMSNTWRAVQQTSQELRHLPNQLMRDAGIEEIEESLRDIGSEAQGVMRETDQEIRLAGEEAAQAGRDISAWTTPPTADDLKEVLASNPGVTPAETAPEPAPGSPTPSDSPEST